MSNSLVRSLLILGGGILMALAAYAGQTGYTDDLGQPAQAPLADSQRLDLRQPER